MIQTLYHRLIRERLPTKIGVYSGIPVPGSVRLLDRTDTFPEYKQANIQALERNVSPGDTVTILGGGKGVTTVIAANQTGTEGRVISIEASKTEVEKTHGTIEMNRVSERVDVIHGIVGELNDAAGELGSPVELHPEQLEPCDVLEIDIEGGELSVLDGMRIRPETIIVETHPLFDSPTNEVVALLESKGYTTLTQRKDPHDEDILTAIQTET